MYTVTVSTRSILDTMGDENQAQAVEIFQGERKLVEIADWREGFEPQTLWSELVQWAQHDFSSKNNVSLDKLSWSFSVEGNDVKFTFSNCSDEQQCTVFLQRAELKDAILQAA